MSTIEQQRFEKWMRLLDGHDAEMSKVAADKLAEIGNLKAVPALIEALEKRTTFVAVASAHALGKMGDDRAIDPLIKALKRHPDLAVQSAAAEALGELRAKEAIPVLKAEVQAYLDTHNDDRFTLTRGFKRGLFTVCIAALKQIGTMEAVSFARQAERAGR